MKNEALVYRANVNNIEVRITRLSECRRRINKRFGRGTMQVKDGSFVTFNTPSGVFQMSTWAGACGICQVVTGRLIVPVLNMLIETGVVRVGKLFVNTRRRDEYPLGRRRRSC